MPPQPNRQRAAGARRQVPPTLRQSSRLRQRKEARRARARAPGRGPVRVRQPGPPLKRSQTSEGEQGRPAEGQSIQWGAGRANSEGVHLRCRCQVERRLHQTDGGGGGGSTATRTPLLPARTWPPPKALPWTSASAASRRPVATGSATLTSRKVPAWGWLHGGGARMAAAVNVCWAVGWPAGRLRAARPDVPPHLSNRLAASRAAPDVAKQTSTAAGAPPSAGETTRVCVTAPTLSNRLENSVQVAEASVSPVTCARQGSKRSGAPGGCRGRRALEAAAAASGGGGGLGQQSGPLALFLSAHAVLSQAMRRQAPGKRERRVGGGARSPGRRRPWRLAVSLP